MKDNSLFIGATWLLIAVGRAKEVLSYGFSAVLCRAAKPHVFGPLYCSVSKKIAYKNNNSSNSKNDYELTQH